MARVLELPEAEFERLYTWRKYAVLSLREKPNYDCVFLETGRGGVRCRIYHARPAQCGAFPFWPDALESGRSWENYAISCPGMNNGAFHGYEEINRILTCYSNAVMANFL
jgi:Fe-S-cluster containining protein